MSESRTYTGGCHCGRVRFEVTTPEITKGFTCNCSICGKRGWVLTFAKRDQIKVLSGEDALTDYQFAKKNIHHLFCSTCGVASYGHGIGKDGEVGYSVNVRCLDDVDISKLEVTEFDGKSI